MKSVAKKMFVLLVITFLASSFSWAGGGSIQLKMEVEKEVTTTDKEGNTVVMREPPNMIIPGDEVIYTVVYTNIGEKEVTDVVISNPVPEHTIYIANSVIGKGTSVFFSVDGGNHFDTPDKLIVTSLDGEERPATAQDYNAIRWLVRDAIQPKKSGKVEYRVRIN